MQLITVVYGVKTILRLNKGQKKARPGMFAHAIKICIEEMRNNQHRHAWGLVLLRLV